jgi:hypothetical protein
VAARHLGRVTPPLEVLAYGPHRHVDPVLFADQIAHGLSGPQGSGDAQIPGAVVVDLLLDVAGLILRERPPGTHGAPGPIAGDRVQATGGVSRPPAAHRLPRHPEQVGEVGFGESQFTAAQGAEAQRLEDFIGQLASVW